MVVSEESLLVEAMGILVEDDATLNDEVDLLLWRKESIRFYFHLAHRELSLVFLLIEEYFSWAKDLLLT